MKNPSTIRHRLALVGLGMVLSALIPVGASAQFCLSQGDCEDGLFCTDDTCFLGVCLRTARNCADLNFQCTADSCSESARRCVHTVTVGLECEDFNIFTDEACNSQGECVAVVCSTCIGDCEINADCPRGFICSQRVCVEEGVLEDTRTPTRTPTRFGFTPITTARPSGTPTRSVTRTSTATRPTLPTSTPSPSPPPMVQCPGDCNGDAAVAVNELVLGVNIALNGLPVSTCPALERDGSGAVDIAELVAAVSAALLGCG